MAYWTHVSENFTSQRLKNLVTIGKETDSQKSNLSQSSDRATGFFPDIDATLSEFEALVSW